ncbi:hypothetical protein D3C84_697650 [compost metagenome]
MRADAALVRGVCLTGGKIALGTGRPLASIGRFDADAWQLNPPASLGSILVKF